MNKILRTTISPVEVVEGTTRTPWWPGIPHGVRRKPLNGRPSQSHGAKSRASVHRIPPPVDVPRRSFSGVAGVIKPARCLQRLSRLHENELVLFSTWHRRPSEGVTPFVSSMGAPIAFKQSPR
jgi:hypothetical protein